MKMRSLGHDMSVIEIQFCDRATECIEHSDKMITMNETLTFISKAEALDYILKLIGDEEKFQRFWKYGKINDTPIWTMAFLDEVPPGKEYLQLDRNYLKLTLELGKEITLNYIERYAE